MPKTLTLAELVVYEFGLFADVGTTMPSAPLLDVWVGVWQKSLLTKYTTFENLSCLQRNLRILGRQVSRSELSARAMTSAKGVLKGLEECLSVANQRTQFTAFASNVTTDKLGQVETISIAIEAKFPPGTVSDEVLQDLQRQAAELRSKVDELPLSTMQLELQASLDELIVLLTATEYLISSRVQEVAGAIIANAICLEDKNSDDRNEAREKSLGRRLALFAATLAVALWKADANVHEFIQVAQDAALLLPTPAR